MALAALVIVAGAGQGVAAAGAVSAGQGLAAPGALIDAGTGTQGAAPVVSSSSQDLSARLPGHVTPGLNAAALPASSSSARLYPAATITVTSCDKPTLDAALAQAQPGDTVAFACSGAITDTLTLATSLTPDATGQQMTLSGGGAGTVISVQSGASVAVQNLTITGGATPCCATSGGGIYNAGTLAVTGSAITNNADTDNNGSYQAGGGGIFSAVGGIFSAVGGIFSAANSTISDNTTDNGGGINSYSPMTADTIATNTAPNGGGIYFSAPLATLSGDTISGNSTPAYGGGLYLDYGTVTTLANTTVSGNAVQYGQGGGIYNFQATLSISASTISDNHADTARGGGGGVYVDLGTLAVANSVISGNSANGINAVGGGIENYEGAATITGATISGNTSLSGNPGRDSADGGGLYANAGTTAITGSAISGNQADLGGGIGNDSGATLALVNSTLSGNAATLQGGGLYNTGNATASVLAGTLSNNTAPSGSGGGVYDDGFYCCTMVTLTSTILAANPAGDCAGPFTSGGYNVVGATCPFVAGVNHDKVGVDPQLGPLRDNGGPTQTQAITSTSSPAYAQVPLDFLQAQGVSTDQRGVPRKSLADTGAFELISPPPSPALTTSAAVVVPFHSVAITGANVGAAEPLTLYWDSAHTAPLTSITTSASGGFRVTMRAPQAISGTHTLIAVGQTSGLSATAPLRIRPLLVSPGSGKAGSRAVLLGFGFGRGERVRAYWTPGILPLGGGAGVTTTVLGSFYGPIALTFTVPLSATGHYIIYAIGQQSKAAGAAVFTITMTASAIPSASAVPAPAASWLDARDVIGAGASLPTGRRSRLARVGRARRI